MRWEVASTERIGGRLEQQDGVACFLSADREDSLLVLGDGMGGHSGGRMASQRLLEVAERKWQSRRACENAGQFLEDLCQEAHDELNLVGAHLDLEPHSTMVALLIQEMHGYWVHVGDSRLYHFRANALVDRTKDHSLLRLLVDAGEVGEEDVANHPNQNLLLRSIGGDTRPKATHGSAALQRDDGFLLCSDGLWQVITVNEMAAALAAPALNESLNQLADLAVARGGTNGDNVSVAGVRIVR